MDEELPAVGISAFLLTDYARQVTQHAMEFEQAMQRAAAFSDLDNGELVRVAEKARTIMAQSWTAVSPSEAVSRVMAPYYAGTLGSWAERQRRRLK